MTNEPRWEAAVDAVAELLQSRVGLRTEPTVRARLRRCVRDEAAVQQCDPETFVALIRSSPDAYQSLLNRVTVQETSFLRHPEQFDILARAILPALTRPVTLWSAGCANGQEAYSLAMLLDEAAIDGRVIATDVSTAALTRTAAGLYSGRELSGLSAHRIARHLTRTPAGWLVSESLQRRVVVLQHNLVDTVPQQVIPAQVVFCRNVLIYLSPEQSKAFLDSVAFMLPSAILFLGSAETMWSLTDQFDAVRFGDTFVHRKRPDKTWVLPEPEPPRFSAPAVRPARRRPPSRAAALSGASHTRAPSGTSRAHEQSAVSQSHAPTGAELDSSGQQALAIGDYASAIADFRKQVYLEPDHPVAHLHLGLALEAAGDHGSAQRAFAAARRALLAAGPGTVENAIEGYAGSELVRLLDLKQEGNR